MTTATTPQSQIALMQGNVATINPQGETARFLLADVKGKDAAASFRVSIIRTAIMETMKGNPRNLKEAVDLVAQLNASDKQRSYVAGFAAITDVSEVTRTVDGKQVKRTGKWTDADNADLRELADTMTAAYTERFANAYAGSLAAQNEARKVKLAAAKAKKATELAPAQAAALADADAVTAALSSTVQHAMPEAAEVVIADAVDAVTRAIQQGLLDADELVMLRLALASYDEGHADAHSSEALAHLLTATPALLAAQAH